MSFLEHFVFKNRMNKKSQPNREMGDVLHPYLNVLAEKDVLSMNLGVHASNVLIDWGMQWLRSLWASKNSSAVIAEQESLIPVTMRTVSLIMMEHKFTNAVTNSQVVELVESLLDVWKKMANQPIPEEKMRQASIIVSNFYHWPADTLFTQLISLVDLPSDPHIA